LVTGPFYSILDLEKPAGEKVYHNKTTCPDGMRIEQRHKRFGTPPGFRLCRECPHKS